MASGQGIEKPRVPVRTALDELRAVREEYAEAFNKKDTATLVSMYAPDATVIRGDGTVLTGKEAIEGPRGRAMGENVDRVGHRSGVWEHCC
jgi:ketosteroid isomerase-like protein